ncbi:MAG: hypothetical protein U0166_23995 [Acidobacteriota bacterium]
MSLRALLSDPGATIAVVAERMDGLPLADCWAALEVLTRPEQRRLYELSSKGPPIDLEHFAPLEVGPLHAVHHRGRNTLPLPPKHRFFEKRFCRPGDGSPRLFGYNEAPSRSWLGPGYFVAYATAQRPDWISRGAIVVDYFQVPDGAVARSWPPVVPNERGLQRFVYKGTRDFMRRVSARVAIGAAFKGEKALDHYFVLCREDTPPAR